MVDENDIDETKLKLIKACAAAFRIDLMETYLRASAKAQTVNMPNELLSLIIIDELAVAISTFATTSNINVDVIYSLIARHMESTEKITQEIVANENAGIDVRDQLTKKLEELFSREAAAQSTTSGIDKSKLH